MQNPALQQLTKNIQVAHVHMPYYRYQFGILRRKGKMLVRNNDVIRTKLIDFYHDIPMGGHSSITATLKRLKQDFYWKKMK